MLKEGYDVRLAGQDTRRGTFSQRHSVLFDYETGVEYTPLANLRQSSGAELDRARPAGSWSMTRCLSEFAALGFEYGYSVESPEARCLGGPVRRLRQRRSGRHRQLPRLRRRKVGTELCARTLFLPHGYEGQGPEHSSAPSSDFSRSAPSDNLTVAQPTTAAQYFHLLRAQTHRSTVGPWSS